ncbi:40S ribosomal protein S19-A [Conidiobolus coronatus NRRL 28638]|uniref:40S ribosomal protein S19-A n=1 Tax=Conidiobolus coronatus (strain ATCC 28846 / CBS 209.66 / NRRL 28638) TaxID=796925 RepID=A0A137NX93_CONC2|nr:40S ribosomal protein S19-A [Conidiobolus coronatus NRRL 28638]|eukprot:KXN67453.1 40S ribosomal protein S19-A [Conidiobolus coronatus NRRL 28638]
MVATTVRDIGHQEFIAAYAAHLKRSAKIEVPAWVDLVKTATHKELAPYDPNWWYVRAAAVARHIYLRPGVGVGHLRRRAGTSKNRGTRPSHHADATGSVPRKVLQALEKIGILEQDQNGGRRITRAGQRELDQIAVQVAKSKQQ